MQFRAACRPWLGAALTLWLLIGAAPWLAGSRGHASAWLRESSHRLVQRTGVDRWLRPWIETPSLTAAGSPSSGIERVGEDGDLRLTFIDVGHGTCVLIEMPNGETWMYDAGHLGSSDRSHQEIAQVLWNRPTARIDRLLVSHADADHYNALPGLVERFSVGQVIASPHFWQHPARELGQLRETLQTHRIQCERMVQGERLVCGDVRVDAMHPPGDWSDKVDNGNSLTLNIHYAGRSCLLPGDLEKAGLERLLSQTPHDCDVLMAPHHGSITHDPAALFRWCTPEWIVISGGPRADRPQVLQRYSLPQTQTVLTHQQGAIQVRIARSGALDVRHWQVVGWQSLTPK